MLELFTLFSAVSCLVFASAFGLIYRKNLGLKAQLDETTKKNIQLIIQLDSSRNFKQEFEAFTLKALDYQRNELQNSNEQSLRSIIQPFQVKLDEFKGLVKESYRYESEQRISLKTQIEESLKLNHSLSREAQKLTQALKTNHKSQGNWGELNLKTILEVSGLKEGREYTFQAKGLELISENRKRQIPDVIVHLPQNKAIIIDSKVSLNAYVQLGQDTSYEEKFFSNIKKHIKDLSSKNYEKLEALKSLDFVIMYIPLDSAYHYLVEKKPSIITESLEQSVIIASSASLITCLRTIYFLWQQEQQNINAKKIAQQGAKMYEKFVGFTHDLMDVGKALSQAESSYQSAIKKLSQGRGNLVAQADKLKELGVSTKKQIPISSSES